MKYSAVVLAFASSAIAANYPRAANGTVVYTTEVVTHLTTYCPEATLIPYGHKTYTATAGETVTITDCPCTVTKPVYKPAHPTTVYYSSCDTEVAPPAATKVIPAPVDEPCPEASSLTIIKNPGKGGNAGNGGNAGYATKTGQVPGAAKPTGVYPTGPTQYTGAATANKVGGLLVAAAGVVAFVL